MKKELELIRENCLLEISSWGGLGPTPGVRGFIIKDNKVYYYHNYYRDSEFLKTNNIPRESLIDKELTEKELAKIKRILRKYINLNVPNIQMFDASFNVMIRIDNKENHIVNNIELYNEIKTKIEGVINNEK